MDDSVRTPAPAIRLKPDYMPGVYNYPDGELAVWKLVIRSGWVAAPHGGATDGTIHGTAEDAARSIGAVLP